MSWTSRVRAPPRTRRLSTSLKGSKSPIAQSEERQTVNLDVVGSNPTGRVLIPFSRVPVKKNAYINVQSSHTAQINARAPYPGARFTGDLPNEQACAVCPGRDDRHACPQGHTYNLKELEQESKLEFIEKVT